MCHSVIFPRRGTNSTSSARATCCRVSATRSRAVAPFLEITPLSTIRDCGYASFSVRSSRAVPSRSRSGATPTSLPEPCTYTNPGSPAGSTHRPPATPSRYEP